ncbi:MAG: helix-turn-helix transcriptional regulator, partial [Candidatus Heimdallarchaeota archaeon]|nr:helix-turn-helix transcriptional regulator [Candidatus Heimdallarchaeota archaeon]MCK5144660.1 helix-turn-helix transcriptional regulator [Candidatus Heimdallarchaeota archaeon]
MFRNIKTYREGALIEDEQIKSYVESFESELLRGISTLSALSIIQRHPDEGIYGYQLLKELEQETGRTLIIEEGTLYP